MRHMMPHCSPLGILHRQARSLSESCAIRIVRN
jgi:hypothetical protein